MKPQLLFAFEFLLVLANSRSEIDSGGMCPENGLLLLGSPQIDGYFKEQEGLVNWRPFFATENTDSKTQLFLYFLRDSENLEKWVISETMGSPVYQAFCVIQPEQSFALSNFESADDKKTNFVIWWIADTHGIYRRFSGIQIRKLCLDVCITISNTSGHLQGISDDYRVINNFQSINKSSNGQQSTNKETNNNKTLTENQTTLRLSYEAKTLPRYYLYPFQSLWVVGSKLNSASFVAVTTSATPLTRDTAGHTSTIWQTFDPIRGRFVENPDMVVRFCDLQIVDVVTSPGSSAETDGERGFESSPSESEGEMFSGDEMELTEGSEENYSYVEFERGEEGAKVGFDEEDEDCLALCVGDCMSYRSCVTSAILMNDKCNMAITAARECWLMTGKSKSDGPDFNAFTEFYDCFVSCAVVPDVGEKGNTKEAIWQLVVLLVAISMIVFCMLSLYIACDSLQSWRAKILYQATQMDGSTSDMTPECSPRIFKSKLRRDVNVDELEPATSFVHGQTVK